VALGAAWKPRSARSLDGLNGAAPYQEPLLTQYVLAHLESRQ